MAWEARAPVAELQRATLQAADRLHLTLQAAAEEKNAEVSPTPARLASIDGTAVERARADLSLLTYWRRRRPQVIPTAEQREFRCSTGHCWIARAARSLILLALSALGGVAAGDSQGTSAEFVWGDCTLSIKPDVELGGGHSVYRMVCANETVWSASENFTLTKAVAAETGIFGYGYAGDWATGIAQELVVARATRDGLHVLERVPRSFADNLLVNGLYPSVSGVIALTQGDCLLHARVLQNCGVADQFWIYSAVGDCRRAVDPRNLLSDPESVRDVLAVEPIRDTPLVLVHWWEAEYEGGRKVRSGARFVAFDRDFEMPWSLLLPNDYLAEERRRPLGWFWREVWSVGRVRALERSGEFEIYSEASVEAVRFRAQAVQDETARWSITEVGRQSIDYDDWRDM